MSTGRRLVLTILPGRFAVWHLAPGDLLADLAQSIFLCRVGDDRSAVIAEEALPAGVPGARGFRCLRLEGEFSLEETGVLARLSAPLAEAEIPLLAFSSFTTDYLLLRERDIGAAQRAFLRHGIRVASESNPVIDQPG
jgi:hypothetical protein